MVIDKEFADIVVICGPTAVGKTAAAMEIAQKIDAEIISADSGQIYRGMDRGTAKPTLEERKKASFHLIDILDPSDHFSAADFRERAVKIMGEIQGRGKRTLVVGGTGLYIRALEMGLFEGPSRDLEVRRVLEKEIEEKGIEVLHQELQKVDPIAASSIPSSNRQRLIRALEVFRLTGRPISQFWEEHRRGAVIAPGRENPAPPFIKFGLALPKDELHHRIEERIDRMIQQGWVEETESLWRKWGPDAPGLNIIGYKDLIAYLQGKGSRKDAIEGIKIRTRQYAKRQMTWFRKDQEIRWVREASELQHYLTK